MLRADRRFDNEFDGGLTGENADRDENHEAAYQ